jgi:hypothetical protein
MPAFLERSAAAAVHFEGRELIVSSVPLPKTKAITHQEYLAVK